MPLSWRAERPGPDDYPEYARRYVARVPDGDVIDTLSRQT